MADKRTSEMVQRRAEYVPEELRPSGWGPSGWAEKAGWYSDNLLRDTKPGMGPWSIQEREYDTKPFGTDIGVDKTMEFILRELLLGNSAKTAREDVDAKKKAALEAALKAQQEDWSNRTNSKSNRFEEQGSFDR